MPKSEKKPETMPKCPFCASGMKIVKRLQGTYFAECQNYKHCWFQGPFRPDRSAAIAAVRAIRVTTEKGAKKR